MIDTVRRSAHPHDAVLGWVERLGRYADVSLHPSARVTPGVVVYRLDDRLFFANARYFKGRVREAIRAAPAPVRWLVLDADAITHADATGLDALLDVTKDLRRDEITLVVARLRTRMEEQLEDAGVLDVIGREHLYPTVRAAVDAFESYGTVRRDGRPAGVGGTEAVGLRRVLPILTWLPAYDRSAVRFDLIAGATLWGLLVPESIAYAGLAGLPPEAGLYTLLATLAAYVLFGTSQHLVVAATSAAAVLLATAVASVEPATVEEYAANAAAVVLLCAGLFLLAGVLRLGFIAQFLSRPVMEGFVFGLAIFVTVKQLPKLFGIPKGEGNSVQQLVHLLTHLDETSAVTLAVGVGALALLVGAERFAPRLPGGLLALVLGIADQRRPRPRPARRRDRRHGAERASLGRASRTSSPRTSRRCWRQRRGWCSSSSASRSAPPRRSPPSTATRSTPTRS